MEKVIVSKQQVTYLNRPDLDELDEADEMTSKQALGSFLTPLQARIFPPGLLSSSATMDAPPSGCTESTMSPLAPEERLLLSITHKHCTRFDRATVGSQDTWRILVAPLQAPSPTAYHPSAPSPTNTQDSPQPQAEQTPSLSRKEK